MTTTTDTAQQSKGKSMEKPPEGLAEKALELKETLAEKSHQIKDTLKELGGIAIEAKEVAMEFTSKILELKEEVLGTKQEVQEKAGELKDGVVGVVEGVKERLGDLRKEAVHLKDVAVEKTMALKERAIDKTSALKDKLSGDDQASDSGSRGNPLEKIKEKGKHLQQRAVGISRNSSKKLDKDPIKNKSHGAKQVTEKKSGQGRKK